MFEIITLTDQITLNASDLSPTYLKTLEQVIRQKYEKKALRDYGFCVKVLDIVTQSGHIYDGDSIFEITIQVLSIKFFPDELLYGTVISNTETGLTVDCFGLIVGINSEKLLNPRFDQEWISNYKDVDLYYEIGEQIRFKIDHIDWTQDEQSKVIKGKCDIQGLGVLKWWQ